MKRILVTGATGFVGKELTSYLLSQNYPVRGACRDENCLPKLAVGVEPCFVGAIGSRTEWRDCLKNIDVVVHAAGMAHVMTSSGKSEQLYYEVNTEGTARLAREAASAGVKRFIYISTAKVMGEERVEPYRGTDAPKPQGAYACSKLKAEKLLLEVARDSGMESVSIRPPLIYGPDVKGNFLSLMRWVRRGVPLPLGAVANRRSMVFVGNLVSALRATIDADRLPDSEYLVADTVMSTPELIEKVALAMEQRANLWKIPPAFLRIIAMMTGNAPVFKRLTGNFTIDDSALREDFAWRPVYSIDEGIGVTVDQFIERA